MLLTESPVAINTSYNKLPIGCINALGCASKTLGILKTTIDKLIKMCHDRMTLGESPDLRDRLSV